MNSNAVLQGLKKIRVVLIMLFLEDFACSCGSVLGGIKLGHELVVGVEAAEAGVAGSLDSLPGAAVGLTDGAADEPGVDEDVLGRETFLWILAEKTADQASRPG